MFWKWCVIIHFSAIAFKCTAVDESQFSIANNKPIQLVDERFVSFNVDPAIFFTGLTNRAVTLQLIENVKPAYLRIAGPSTQFLEFSVNQAKATKFIDNDSTSLVFTPQMWWSFNEWIHRTNLTPIFAVNDKSKVNGKWDSKTILPLLDLTAKMNVNCYWELGYDCSDKGFEKYKADLTTFRHMLDAFPTKKDKWQIIGSDLGKCTPSDHAEILRMYLADLQDAHAIMWENTETSSFVGGDIMQKLLSVHQASLPVWLSTPKTEHTITFDHSISWAIEMGEAAKNGFAVIFREPRVQEFYSATSAYWVTVLHKNLMGRTVLDVKTTSFSHQNDAYIYAHCSKDQNSFSVRGAITIMIANNGSQPHKTSFRLPTQIKSVEVRSYILSTKSDSMDTYLNDEKLTLNDFKLSPKLRRAKVLSHLTLNVPGKSIAFYVLPGAKMPICIDNEDDTRQILEEIDKIQALDFPESEKPTSGLFSRLNTVRSTLSLADLHRKLEDELKMDAPLIPKLKLKSFVPPNDDLKQKTPQANPARTNANVERKNLLDDARQNFNDVKRKLDKVKPDIKPMDLKNLLGNKDAGKKGDDILGMAKPKLDLELSNAEVLKILGDRAKAKFEKKVGLADLDLDFDGIFENALKGKFTKRAINMDLLEEQVHEQEQKAHLPKAAKKLKNIAKHSKATQTEEDSEDLPDMSKIIPGFEKSSRKKEHESSLFGKKGATPKLDLFSLEGLEIPSLFSLLSSKTTTSTTTRKPSNTEHEFDRSSDFTRHLEELEKDMNNHQESFLEQFGDKVTIHPKKHLFHDLGAAWDFNDDDEDSLLENEFIINDESDVPGTIEKLERYFNHPSRIDKIARFENKDYHDYFEPAFDSFESFGRFKREIYGKIKEHLKDLKKNNILGHKSLNNLISKPSGDMQALKPTFALSKMGPNELKRKWKQDQRGLVEAHRKLLRSDDLSRKFYKKHPSLRHPRDLRKSDEEEEEVYIPQSNLSNTILGRYNSKLNWDEWQPADILNLPNNYRVLQLGVRDERIDFDDIPIRTRTRIHGRNARHVDEDAINSMENAVDDFLNTVEKDAQFTAPLLDEEEDAYLLVWPSRDKLAMLRQKNGDTEIVIHRESPQDNTVSESSDDVDSNTCLAVDLNASQKDNDATTKGYVAPVSEAASDDDNTTDKHEDKDVADAIIKGFRSGEKRVNRSEYVQKIPPKGKSSEGGHNGRNFKFTIVGSIVRGFNRFIKTLHKKVDTFFKSVE